MSALSGTIFGREPTAIAGAIRAVILCATTFGLKWTTDQVAATMLAVEAVLTVLVRQTVTSPATLKRDYVSKAQAILGYDGRHERGDE